ncbi:MAG TPA: hypothetical protein PK961_18305, partial [bacterium]|nr:hypothetical protein [bacterium]
MKRIWSIVLLIVCTAVAASAEFTIDTVDQGGVGAMTDIALGVAGWPAVCYYDETNGDLKVAELGGGGWSLAVVDANGNVGGDCSIYVDTGNDPHIAYLDNENLDLRYAYRDGGTWYSEMLEE